MTVPTSYEQIKVDVCREVLRQSKLAFDCRLYTIRASILMILIGCGLPFIGYPTEG